jgi:hypothetical protein
MEQPVPSFKVRRRQAQRTLGKFLRRGRFSKRDVQYNPRLGRVEIGIWLPDRAGAEYEPYFLLLKRATLHWRLHTLTIANALNFEFHIEKEVPFAAFSAARLDPSKVRLFFEAAMFMTMGISELSITVDTKEQTRMDWDIKRLALRLAREPIAANV